MGGGISIIHQSSKHHQKANGLSWQVCQYLKPCGKLFANVLLTNQDPQLRYVTAQDHNSSQYCRNRTHMSPHIQEATADGQTQWAAHWGRESGESLQIWWNAYTCEMMRPWLCAYPDDDGDEKSSGCWEKNKEGAIQHKHEMAHMRFRRQRGKWCWTGSGINLVVCTAMSDVPAE